MDVTFDNVDPPAAPFMSSTTLAPPTAVSSIPAQPTVTIQPRNHAEVSKALAMALHGRESISEETAALLCTYFDSKLEADAVAGLHHMIGPNSNWSSSYQHLLVLLVLSEHQDLIGVLPTGGGKSLAWNIYAWTHRRDRTLVVLIPNKSLLEEQLRRSTSKDIQAQRLSSSIITNWKAVHDTTPLWFVPLETFTSSKWSTYVVSLFFTFQI